MHSALTLFYILKWPCFCIGESSSNKSKADSLINQLPSSFICTDDILFKTARSIWWQVNTLNMHFSACYTRKNWRNEEELKTDIKDEISLIVANWDLRDWRYGIKWSIVADHIDIEKGKRREYSYFQCQDQERLAQYRDADHILKELEDVWID